MSQSMELIIVLLLRRVVWLVILLILDLVIYVRPLLLMRGMRLDARQVVERHVLGCCVRNVPVILVFRTQHLLQGLQKILVVAI